MGLSANTTKLLLVEDDSEIRDSLVEILEDEGYNVAAASDGAEAIRYLDEATVMPSLILLDLMMPVMDGFHFREEQLKNPRYSRIPVAVLTAVGRAEQRAEQLQAAGFLDKPMTVRALLSVVESALAAGE